MVETGEIEVPEGVLRWSASGHGSPIVLAHGFSFDRSMWAAELASLGGRFRVIAYDLRGFGSSTLPVGRYSHTEDLRHLLQGLNVERPILLGLSLGANTVLDFAGKYPDIARAIIAVSPGLPEHSWTEERPPDAVARYAAQHGVEAAKRFWIDHPIFASLRGTSGWTAIDRMVCAYHAWHWTNHDPRVPFSMSLAVLRTLTMPVLVLSGDRDVAGYRQIARRIADAVPGAKLATMADAGHVANLDDPSGFARRVIDFAASLPA